MCTEQIQASNREMTQNKAQDFTCGMQDTEEGYPGKHLHCMQTAKIDIFCRVVVAVGAWLTGCWLVCEMATPCPLSSVQLKAAIWAPQDGRENTQT